MKWTRVHAKSATSGLSGFGVGIWLAFLHQSHPELLESLDAAKMISFFMFCCLCLTICFRVCCANASSSAPECLSSRMCCALVARQAARAHRHLKLPSSFTIVSGSTQMGGQLRPGPCWGPGLGYRCHTDAMTRPALGNRLRHVLETVAPPSRPVHSSRWQRWSVRIAS